MDLNTDTERPNSTKISIPNSYVKYQGVATCLPPLNKIHKEINLRILAQSKGKLSSYFLQLSRTWDQGSRQAREKILEEFVKNNQNKTGPQLEMELGNGASLFLTRISAWLRLTYLLSYNIQIQLRAISIFISASGGHRFLGEFLEVGGVLTVLEILGLPQAKEPEKAESLRLLTHIANCGRTFKEFICESYGVRAVSDCLSRTKSDVVADYCRNLLHQLGVGNPRFMVQVFKSMINLINAGSNGTAQQMAAQALRFLLPSIHNVHKSAIDSATKLLKSSYIQLQYEGYELLKEFVKRKSLKENVLATLVNILKIAGEEVGDIPTTGDTKNQEEKNSKSNNWQQNNQIDQKKILREAEYYLSIYTQQSYAAKLVGVLAATDSSLADKLLKLNIIKALLNTVSNVNHPDCQRYAANSLLFFVENYKVNLKDYLGQNFADIFNARPDTFFRELTTEQILFLRSATKGLEVVDHESDHESVDSVDEEGHIKRRIHKHEISKSSSTPVDDEDFDEKSISKTPPVKHTPNTKKFDENNEEKSSVNGEPIKSMYLPFDLLHSNAIFAGSKFNQEADIVSNDNFNIELEKLRSKKSLAKETKEEISLNLSKKTNEHMQHLAQDRELFNTVVKPSS